MNKILDLDAKARFATIHWVRYPGIKTAEQFQLQNVPAASMSWKIGPDGPLGPDGFRLSSDVWCAVALFRDEADAQAALVGHDRFLPQLDTAIEHWHALLLAVTHKGECNHLDQEKPGPIFDGGQRDPGGPLFAMTTAGFNLGPKFDIDKVIDFRRNVDLVREWLKSADGLVAMQVFAPHTRGDDGVTMTVWTTEAKMASVMYRPGMHRTQVDRYRAGGVADRSSFTRFRALKTLGSWGGSNPIERARK